MRDHLLNFLENDHFTPFPSCICPSSFCLSYVERILEVDCRTPELKTIYFGFQAGDMIDCTHCKEWFHDCCKKIPKNISKLIPLIISLVKYAK